MAPEPGRNAPRLITQVYQMLKEIGASSADFLACLLAESLAQEFETFGNRRLVVLIALELE